MRYICSVAHCRYVASATIEDAHVCRLHDHPAVRQIFEDLLLPAAFFGGDDRPLVLPVRDLVEADLIPQLAPDNAIEPWECPLMAAVPDGHSRVTHERFDLTR